MGELGRNELIQLWLGGLLSVVLSIAMLYPAFIDVYDDSFPFSTYPMFSDPRLDPGLTLFQALAVFPDGRRKPVSPELATGNEEVIQAMGTIRRETRRGKGRAKGKAFCEQIAARVATSEDPKWQDAVEIELARSQFNTVRYFKEERAPETRKTLRRCPIPR